MGVSQRFSLVLALCLSVPCSAQLLQGTIDGNVTDASQAALVGATVTVTNQGTTLGRETITNSLGEYTLPPCHPASIP